MSQSQSHTAGSEQLCRCRILNEQYETVLCMYTLICMQRCVCLYFYFGSFFVVSAAALSTEALESGAAQ